MVVTGAELTSWAGQYTPIDAQYHTRARAGQPVQDQPVVRDGASLLDVARLAPSSPIPARSITYVVVSSTNGTDMSQVSGDDLRQVPSPWEQGLVPAVFPDGSAADYIRPLLSDGTPTGTAPADTNADEYYFGASIVVDFHTTGRLLSPQLTASPTSVRRGGSVGFTVAGGCPDPQPGDVTTFDYGDGGGDTSGQHTYADPPGTYYADADVSCADGSSGETPPVAVTVQGATPTTQPTTQPPTSRSSAPPTSRPTAGGTGGSGSAGDGGGSQHGGAPTPVPGTPTPGLTSTAATASGAAGTGDGGAGGASSAPTTGTSSGVTGTPPASTGAARSSAHAAPAGSGGVRVAGYLLDVPAAGSPALRAARPRPAAAPSAAAPTGRGVGAGVLGALAVIVLLAVGAVRERRRPSRSGRRRSR